VPCAKASPSRPAVAERDDVMPEDGAVLEGELVDPGVPPAPPVSPRAALVAFEMCMRVVAENQRIHRGGRR
jgi:hypothetical protein